MRALYIAALLVVPSLALAQTCPPGQVPGVDAFFKPVCRGSTGSGVVSTLMSKPKDHGCIQGTVQAVDEHGRHFCQSITAGERFKDAPHDCPTGTKAALDHFGNHICRKT